MKKNDLAMKLMDAYQLPSKKQAIEMVELVLNEIMNAVKAGEEVAFSGFGIFKVVDRKARMGVNPKTGEKIQIAASRKLKFRAAKAFKELVQ